MTSRNTLLLIAALFAAAAVAQDDGDGERRQRRGPPPAALEACESAAQGESCAFSGRENEVLEGVCFAPENKPLACRPEGGKRNTVDGLE